MKDYQKQLTKLCVSEEEIATREQEKKKAYHYKDFHFFSANLSNFLPNVPQSEHERVYLDICSMFQRLTVGQEHPQLIDELIVEGDTSFIGNKGSLPAIFCTYHMGSYRAIIGLLAKLGIDFVLAAGGSIYERQKAKITKQVEAFHQTYGKEAFFDIVNVSHANATLALTTHLMKGRSLVAYVDSNTGVGGVHHRNDSMIKMNFLGKPIYSRKGLAVLSFLTKRPLVPAVSYYKEVDRVDNTLPAIRFYPPIYPPSSRSNRDAYFSSATKKLYGILEENIEQHYDQWEGWLYVHRYLDSEYLQKVEKGRNSSHDPITTNQLVFNDRRYGLFKIEDDGYALDKLRYTSIKLSEPLFNFLAHLQEDRVVTDNVSTSLVKSLVNNNILVARSA